MAKSKEPRADSAGMGQNPWLKYPVLPPDTFGMIGDDMSPLQDNGVKPSELESDQNQKFLDSLAAADKMQGAGPAPAAAATAPVTPPIQDTRVPAPQASPSPADLISLSQSGLPKGAAPVTLNDKGEAQAPDAPGTNLFMPPLSMDADAPPSRMQPYNKHIEVDQDTGKTEHKGVKNSYQSPQLYAQLLDTIMGKRTPQAVDANGNPKFAQQPILDEKGMPVMGPDGKPLTKNGDPILDDSKTTVDANSPYQQTLGTIKQQQGSLQDLLNYTPVQRDLSPLMTFAGILSKHPELAKNYSPGAPFSDTLEKVIAARKGIGDQQNKLFSDATASAKAMKDGSNTDLASQILMNKMTDETGTKPNNFQDRMDLLDARNADLAHRQVVQSIKKDPSFNNLRNAYQTLGNSISLLQNPSNVTKQQVTETQQRIRQAIAAGASGSGTTGAEREAATAQTLGMDLQDFHQFLSGDPAKIQADSGLVKHLAEIAATEQQNIDHIGKKRMNTLAQGYDYVYNDPRWGDKYTEARNGLLSAAGGEFDAPGATPLSGGKQRTAKAIAPLRDAAVARRRQDAADEAAKQVPPPSYHDLEDDDLDAELSRRGIQ